MKKNSKNPLNILAYGLQALHSVLSFALNAMLLYTLWRFGMPLHAAEGFGPGALPLFAGLSAQLTLLESFIGASVWVSQAPYAALCFYAGKKVGSWLWLLGSACHRLLFARSLVRKKTSQPTIFARRFSVHAARTVFLDVAFMLQWMAGIAFLYALPISSPFAWSLYLLVIAVDALCLVFGQGALRYACDKYLDVPETGHLIVQLVYLPLRMWSLMYIPLPQVFLHAMFVLECVAPVLNWFATLMLRTLLSNKTVLEPKEAYVIHTLVHACLQVGRTMCACAFLAYRFPVFLPMYWLPASLCLWLTQEFAKILSQASTENVSSSFFKQQMIFWKAVGHTLLRLSKWLRKCLTPARRPMAVSTPSTSLSQVFYQKNADNSLPASIPVAPSSTLSIAQTSACSRDGAPSSPSAKKHADHTALGVATGSVKAAVKQSQQSIDPLGSSEALMGHDAGHANMHLDAKNKARSWNLPGHASPPAASAIHTPQSPLGKGPCLKRLSKAIKRLDIENTCNGVSKGILNGCKENGATMSAGSSTSFQSPLLPIDQLDRSGLQDFPRSCKIPDRMQPIDFSFLSALNATDCVSPSEAGTPPNSLVSSGSEDSYVPFVPKGSSRLSSYK